MVHLLTNLITAARPFLFHVITHLEREKSVRAGDKSQEMMIGTVGLSIQLFFLFICWIKRQSFLHSAYHKPGQSAHKRRREMNDRSCPHNLFFINPKINNVGTDDRSLFIFSFFFVPARLSFPFRRAIHLQMTS